MKEHGTQGGAAAPGQQQARVRLLLLVPAWLLLGGCFSTSLLTTPRPTPAGAIRGTPAIAIQRVRSEGSDGAFPIPEGALRYGVSEWADIGAKIGPVYAEVNSVLQLASSQRFVLSAIPGASMSSFWESYPAGAEQSGSTVLKGSPTHVAALKLPLIAGWEGRYVGFLLGPTVQGGYRFCRDTVRSDYDLTFQKYTTHTCNAVDKGFWLGVGGHFGVQISIGSFVKIMPEFALLKLLMAPPIREAVLDEPRTSFTEGQLLGQFAIGIQLGRFVRPPRPERWSDQE